MTRISLFHSVLGVRAGILAAAEVFSAAGHQVQVVDQYAGRVFDDYDEANAFCAAIGFPALMRAALDAVAEASTPFVTAGFSNGGGMAEYVAAARGGLAGGVIGSVQFSGAIALAQLGLTDWPPGTPVQLHYSAADPHRDQAWVDTYLDSVRASGSEVESYLDYPISGHLFTDKTLPDEYDEKATTLLFSRALDFLERLGRQS